MSDHTVAEANVELAKFEKCLKIDRSNLLAELEGQADVWYQISRHCSLAISRRDEAKVNLERIEAQVQLKIRRLATEKLTERSIETQVTVDREYINAQDYWLKLKLIADNWLALKEAYHSRSFMLRDLVNQTRTDSYMNSEGADVRMSEADRIREEAGALREKRRRVT